MDKEYENKKKKIHAEENNPGVDIDCADHDTVNNVLIKEDTKKLDDNPRDNF